MMQSDVYATEHDANKCDCVRDCVHGIQSLVILCKPADELVPHPYMHASVHAMG